MAPNKEQAIPDTQITPPTPATPPRLDCDEPDAVPPQCGHGRASCSDFQKQYDWGQRMRQERDDTRAALAVATAERDEILAARIAYASEFPPTAEGDPDVGSIRNLKSLVAAMRQSCLSWFDAPSGPWGYECVGCTATFTKSAGPGQPPSETRAYAELVHDADCVFHPSPRLPSSSDEDLP